MMKILAPEDVSDAELSALNDAIEEMERGPLREFLTFIHNQIAAGVAVIITDR